MSRKFRLPRRKDIKPISGRAINTSAAARHFAKALNGEVEWFDSNSGTASIKVGNESFFMEEC